MKNAQLNKKEINTFKLIVEYYISSGEPVGSVNLISHFNLKVSSATIRNQMAVLEKYNFIEKAHISSGRIPTLDGIKFYAEFLAQNPDEKILERIKKIFEKRKINIDETIEEAAKVISNISGLTLVTSNNSNTDNLMLKNISLTQISDSECVVVLVSSDGNVFNKSVDFKSKNISINDLNVAVRLFQERLIDSKLYELNEKVQILLPILKRKIKDCDKIIEAFVNNIFYFNSKKEKKIYGKSFIIESNEIERTKLSKIIDFIENKSIWDSIEEFSENDSKLKIEINNSNVSLLSKRIELGKIRKDISIIGTKRMDYSTAKNVLNVIEEIISKKE